MVKEKDDKPKAQILWNDLNESYSPNVFFTYATRRVVSCLRIYFCFEFLERRRTWKMQSLVENSIIWEQGKKGCLSCDK